MRLVIITILVAVLAFTGFSLVIGRLSQEREILRHESELGEVIPSAVSKIVALDFKGLFSDIFFFKAYMYYGGKVTRSEVITDKDWEWFNKNIIVATDLDPFFMDPYYLGSINLAWQANKVDEADALLEKGTRSRTWDWTLPYYLGFNYFYFSHDNVKAAQYLMEAAKRPGGGGGLVPSLAARLAQAGGETESAIAFLEDIISKQNDEPTRYIYSMRLNAFKKVRYLELATERYHSRFGRLPRSLDELIKRGIINDIPRDPYGGSFYITTDGKIKTTSNFMVVRK